MNHLASSWPSSLDGLRLCDKDFGFFQRMPFTRVSIGSSSSFGAESLTSFLKDPRRDKLQVLSVHNHVLPTLGGLLLPSLTQLELSACGLQADDVLSLCSSLKGLVSLDLSANPFSDHALSQLGECPRLQALNLSDCDMLSDASLLHLPKTLRVLSLSGVKLLTDGGLLNLRQLTSLEALNLSGLEVTDAGVLSVGALPLLSTLDVSGTNVTALSLVTILFRLRLVCLLRCRALSLKTLFHHLPSGMQVVREQHVFGDQRPWFKQMGINA